MKLARPSLYRKPLASACAGFFGLTALVIAPVGYGALGGSAASVAQDSAALSATAGAPVSFSAYVVHELRVPSGTVVREYLSAGGTVFAIAWSGPAMPDLRRRLGPHFEAYTEAARTQQAGPGPLEVRQAGLVVESGGRMRAFFGRAYLPAAIPAGVALDDIQ
jgi:hypothetical protein